ncbi:molecular chaperone DnaJ [Actinacidiphila yanglinensis]|uniref:Molecular chaperone DnaJ n=1 Tax=Actinacidiphila yanglinensis TaxID=310779 RepID=A0A1H6CTK5_9ACTN|nr:DnaJ C-terminal domain-containing protein [Actinacidiphila yanglinensis]SEG76330.1 molecular chaperone DnaJ [Actinacidiphila yanglinensis]
MTDSTPGSGRREALLIATGRYDNRSFKALRSPGQDSARLAAVLADRNIGGFRTQRVSNASAHRVLRAIEGFFQNRSRNDLLLLHISCHGIKDDEDGSLYFAARDTDRDLLASTAVPASFLRERMDRCRASIVLLLDCCYSGAFLPGMKGDDRVHVQDDLGGHGRAVLTATSRTEYAWEGGQLKTGEPVPSRFTGAIIEGLSTGAADSDGDGRITVTELYDYVYETLQRAGVKQSPRMWADLEYQVMIARAAGPAGAGRTRRARQTVPPAEAPPLPSDPPPASDPLLPSDVLPPYYAPQETNPGASAAGEFLAGYLGRDELIQLPLNLVEMAQGTVKDVHVDTWILCPECKGSGWGRWEILSCSHCYKGDQGRARGRRTLTIKVPAGVEKGTRVRFRGKGAIGRPNAPAGDLYVEIEEIPHDDFQRIGHDLYGRLFLSPWEASNGGTFPFETLLDGPRHLVIPPGVPDGQFYRLRKLGVRHLSGGDRGDLLIRVHIRD